VPPAVLHQPPPPLVGDARRSPQDRVPPPSAGLRGWANRAPGSARGARRHGHQCWILDAASAVQPCTALRRSHNAAVGPSRSLVPRAGGGQPGRLTRACASCTAAGITVARCPSSRRTGESMPATDLARAAPTRSLTARPVVGAGGRSPWKIDRFDRGRGHSVPETLPGWTPRQPVSRRWSVGGLGGTCPRFGLSMANGQARYFDSPFSEELDDYGPFKVWPASDVDLERELRMWSIWIPWRQALARGEVSGRFQPNDEYRRLEEQSRPSRQPPAHAVVAEPRWRLCKDRSFRHGSPAHQVAWTQPRRRA
jgi:hypothetical protein